MNAFKLRRFHALIILQCVRWYSKYTVSDRQLKEMMNEASTAVDSLSKAGSPPELVAKSTELAKGAFEHALANMKQLRSW